MSCNLLPDGKRVRVVGGEVDGVRTCVHTRERKRLNSGTGVFFWNLSDQVNCMENTVPGLRLQLILEGDLWVIMLRFTCESRTAQTYLV